MFTYIQGDWLIFVVFNKPPYSGVFFNLDPRSRPHKANPMVKNDDVKYRVSQLIQWLFRSVPLKHGG